MNLCILDNGYNQHANVMLNNLRKRIPVEVAQDGLKISLAIDSKIGIEESYQILFEDSMWKIIGSDILGLYFGIGKFLHTAKWHDEMFYPNPPQGVISPDCSYRVIYFSVHAYNWYHMAPTEDLEEYLEELLLWGYNGIHQRNLEYCKNHSVLQDSPLSCISNRIFCRKPRLSLLSLQLVRISVCKDCRYPTTE